VLIVRLCDTLTFKTLIPESEEALSNSLSLTFTNTRGTLMHAHPRFLHLIHESEEAEHGDAFVSVRHADSLSPVDATSTAKPRRSSSLDGAKLPRRSSAALADVADALVTPRRSSSMLVRLQ
jgi:hypothetical protein